jgi:hypothetical protein
MVPVAVWSAAGALVEDFLRVGQVQRVERGDRSNQPELRVPSWQSLAPLQLTTPGEARPARALADPHGDLSRLYGSDPPSATRIRDGFARPEL